MKRLLAILTFTVICSTLLSKAVIAHPEITPHVSVTGAAITEVEPDLIYWQLSVKNNAFTVEDVAAKHSALVTQVLRFLAKQSIKSNDIQTSNMQFNEKFKYEQRNTISDGFYASTQITFKLSDTNKYQQLWLGLSKLSNVSIQNVRFDTSERIAIQNETRVKALLAAKEKATVLAKSLNVDIGDPILIEEHSSTPMSSNTMRIKSFSDMEGAALSSSSLALGKISIEMTVNAKFALQTLINR